MRAKLLTASVGLALIGAACGGNGGSGPPILPTSEFPSETPGTAPPTGATGVSGVSGPTGMSGVSGPTGALPSAPPGGEGTLTSGSVTFGLSGDVEAETTLSTLVSGSASAPPGGFALVWTSGGTGTTVVGIGGGSFTGTRPTAPTLTLSVAAQSDAGVLAFVSSAGECSITIDVAEPSRFEGSFRCTSLRSATGEVIDASGSFEATG